MGFKAVHYTEVKVEEVKEEGFKGVTVRWLVSKEDGAENFAMRCFEIKPGGKTAFHSHDWEHEVFVLNGTGKVRCNNTVKEIKPGYVVFIPANCPHNFENSGEEILRFLCLIPYKK
ncbi:cupin domain-containing protein [Candidatus Bathyarchaeota archaeon]|nr:cupin domain-containing protein [Candidatus Bathyarchaeota archaeon]